MGLFRSIKTYIYAMREKTLEAKQQSVKDGRIYRILFGQDISFCTCSYRYKYAISADTLICFGGYIVSYIDCKCYKCGMTTSEIVYAGGYELC